MTGTLISCSSESDDLRDFFFDLFDRFLQSVGATPSERDVEKWIEYAVRLFADLEGPPAREIRGLWGELLVIASARRGDILIRRWHEEPTDRFDFSNGRFAIEIKASRDNERIHHFSLRQLRPLAEIEVVVASVVVTADPSGCSVLELLREIEARYPSQALRDKMRTTVFRLAGRALINSDQRFERAGAVESVRWIRARSIPATDEEVAEPILDVSLKVRCRDIPSDFAREDAETRLQ